MSACSYVPLDELLEQTKVRVLRAARRRDWFAMTEIAEDLGIDDARERNTLSQSMTRMTRAGLFERRESTGFKSGVIYDYRITQAGIAELDALMSGRSRTRRYFGARSAS